MVELSLEKYLFFVTPLNPDMWYYVSEDISLMYKKEQIANME